MAGNIVEYTLSLQDKISGKLSRIGIANDRQLAVWSRVQRQVVQADRTMQDFGVSIGSLTGRIVALRAEREWIPAGNIKAIRTTNREIQSLERQLRRLESTTGGRLKAAFSEAFGSLPFASAITNPIVLAGTAGLAALKKGFDREKTQISFEVLLGSKEAGGRLVSDLRQYGAATPYMAADLQENAKMMLSFGIAADRVMPNIKMLGDIAMGDREKMNSLTLAFSQMTSTGKLMGQDLLQMINAGFNPLNEISRTTGKSMAVLKDEMSKGEISAEMVRDAFISATSAGGLFYNMTERLGSSKSGKWSTLLDNAAMLLWKLYDIIEPFINPAFAVFSRLIDYTAALLSWIHKGVTGCVSAFRRWFDLLSGGNTAVTVLTALLGIMAATMGIVIARTKLAALWAGIVTTAKWAWTAAQTALNASMWASPTTWIIAGVVALIAVIAYLCYKIEGWGSLWEGVVGFMKYTFYAFVDGVKLYFSTLVNGIMIGLDKIKLGWYEFKEAVGLGNSAENRAAIAAIGADVEARQQAITAGAQRVADHLKNAGRSLAGIDMSWNSEKSLSDIVSGFGAKLGISSPSIPGLGGSETESGINPTGGEVAKNATEAVATGGTRNTTINISIGNMVERIVYEGGYDDNRENMERDMESLFIRVLQMAKTAQ